MTHSNYRGWYRRESVHKADADLVFERAKAHGVEKFLITTNTLNDAEYTHRMSCRSDGYYTTIGVNPMHCNDVFRIAEEGEDISREQLVGRYFQKMKDTLKNSTQPDKYLAIG